MKPNLLNLNVFVLLTIYILIHIHIELYTYVDSDAMRYCNFKKNCYYTFLFRFQAKVNTNFSSLCLKTIVVIIHVYSTYCKNNHTGLKGH